MPSKPCAVGLQRMVLMHAVAALIFRVELSKKLISATPTSLNGLLRYKELMRRHTPCRLHRPFGSPVEVVLFRYLNKKIEIKMTTYGRNAKNVGLKSKIDELDMLINSFQNSDEKDMLVELKNLREQLSKMLNILE